MESKRIGTQLSIRNDRCGFRLAAFAALALLTCLAAGAYAQQGALAYDAQTRGPVPIPPSERGLQTVIAEPWFKFLS